MIWVPALLFAGFVTSGESLSLSEPPCPVHVFCPWDMNLRTRLIPLTGWLTCRCGLSWFSRLLYSPILRTATSLTFLNHSYVSTLLPNLPWLPLFCTTSSLPTPSPLPSFPFSPSLIFGFLPGKHLMVPHPCRAPVCEHQVERHPSGPICSGGALRKPAVLTLVAVGARVRRVALTASITVYPTVAHSVHTAAHCRHKTGIFFISRYRLLEILEE